MPIPFGCSIGYRIWPSTDFVAAFGKRSVRTPCNMAAGRLEILYMLEGHNRVLTVGRRTGPGNHTRRTALYIYTCPELLPA